MLRIIDMREAQSEEDDFVFSVWDTVRGEFLQSKYGDQVFTLEEFLEDYEGDVMDAKDRVTRKVRARIDQPCDHSLKDERIEVHVTNRSRLSIAVLVQTDDYGHRFETYGGTIAISYCPFCGKWLE